MTTEIRRSNPEDAAALRELLHRAHSTNLAAGFNFSAATFSLERMQEVIAEGEGYVLTEDGRIVGTITIWPDGSIGVLGVDPECGGHGYGTRLIAFAEERARQKGWTRLVLDTPVTHPWLPAFYQRLGYQPVRTTRWEGKRYDSVIMEKAL